ncbi:transmembrane protein 179 [Patella vulgata]|uniref:transmembrane protein 179 n=1 Tax=Patella vulgata TaxID=6465 RepID=UPI00217F82CF|nr:transmembrane protein 179 [Patella vulgata]
MALGNLIVLSQVTCFILSFLLSFFVFVPVSINNHEFNGHCLLHATGKWHPESKQANIELTDLHWGPSSACNFSVFIGVVVMVTSFCYTIWVSIYLFKGTDSSWLDAFMTFIVSVLVTICLFSTALTISGGFAVWCSLVTDKLSGIDRCEMGDYTTFLPKNLNIDSSNYYMEFQIAQFGIWGLWMCWVVLTLLSIIKLYRYHKQEAFLKSVNHQRQRLLQRVGHSSSYSGDLST